MGADELTGWLEFQHLYDLPDGFFVAGQVCSAIAKYFAGAQHPPEHFVPYYKQSATSPREQTPEETRAVARVYLDAARKRAGRV